MNKLERIKFVNNDAENAERPVFIIVMDGVGLAPDTASNAVKNAKTPTLDMLMEKYPMLKLKAHGHGCRPSERRRYGQLRGRP